MKQFMLFNEMATFAIIVEEGSFTRAATRLKRSKAYVSQQLSRLEDALGVALLYRTTRKLELTEAGRACHAHCKMVFESGQELQRTISSLRGEMTGSLKITVPVSLGEVFCGDIVFDFIKKYPEIKIELELENARQDLIAKGYDLGIRVTHEPQDDLVALRVGDLIEVTCASAGYLKNHEIINKPSDLSLHRCIINRHQADQTIWSFEKDGLVENIRVDSVVSFNHYPLVKQAVLQGQGIAKLPQYLIKSEIETGRIIALFDDYVPEKTPIYLVYPYHGALPLRTRVLIDFVTSWLRKELI